MQEYMNIIVAFCVPFTPGSRACCCPTFAEDAFHSSPAFLEQPSKVLIISYDRRHISVHFEKVAARDSVRLYETNSLEPLMS